MLELRGPSRDGPHGAVVNLPGVRVASDKRELHDVDDLLHVVEHHDALVEGKVQVGKVAIVGGRGVEWELLRLGVAHGVVAGEADPAAQEAPGARPLLPGCFLGGWVGFAGYDTVRTVS